MAVKPKLTVNIRERDLGLASILKEAAKLRKKPFVKAGVTQAKGSMAHAGTSKTVADIAQIHEFGAPEAGIPERSFLRSTVSKNQEKYDGHIAQLRDQIFDANSEMTVERALGVIGQEVSSDVKNTIRAGIEPALSEATVRAKNAPAIKAGKTGTGNGSSTPLIDTGQLVNSISYEVVLDGTSTGGAA